MNEDLKNDPYGRLQIFITAEKLHAVINVFDILFDSFLINYSLVTRCSGLHILPWAFFSSCSLSHKSFVLVRQSCCSWTCVFMR